MSVHAELTLGLAPFCCELPQAMDFPRSDTVVVEPPLGREARLDLLLESCGVRVAGTVRTLSRSLLYLVDHLVPPRRGSLAPGFGMLPGGAYHRVLRYASQYRQLAVGPPVGNGSLPPGGWTALGLRRLQARRQG